MTLDNTPPRRPLSVGKPARAASAEDNQRDDDLDESSPHGLHRALQMMPGWAASGLFHMTLLIVLALIPLLAAQSAPQELVMSRPEEVVEPDPDPVDVTKIDVSTPDIRNTDLDDVSPPEEDPVDVITPDPEPLDPAGPTDFDVLGPPVESNGTGPIIGGGDKDGSGTYDRRGIKGHPHAPGDAENAVNKALKWLAAHQNRDGSWGFDHREGECQGRCGNHGALKESRIGATAMGLLPFLGYGHTHQKGKYKNVVRAVLAYLMREMKQNGSLHESGGTMYSHGLAAIALCEAYAMTRDRALFSPAQRSLDFISAAQDPVGGGWRYHPKQAGDTSVVGWQIMALKSGHLSGLTINPHTIRNAARFLDSVQSESGAFYGYTTPGKGSATTAIGLLCRMYLGWKHDNPALERGVNFLSKTGPSQGNMYYNYYATQLIYQSGGPPWKRWNRSIQGYLVGAQAKNGHMLGSWFFPKGDHGADKGGRLYCTAMGALCLEESYRHMPLNRHAAGKFEEKDEPAEAVPGQKAQPNPGAARPLAPQPRPGGVQPRPKGLPQLKLSQVGNPPNPGGPQP
ncbi:MAG: hypothetical protein IIA67_10840, partial [Planctomycetes bacterium]|nr:hypothetical protein [Planctomycetota bacterium]